MHTGFTGPSILMDFENERAIILLTNRIHPSRDNAQYLEERIKLHVKFLESKI
jgi:CubicO group peptidase (beta-lactamase class C family)